ncbi:hypothetical protein ACFX10_034493 [Malus domestica]
MSSRMREELGVALGRFVMVDYDIEDSCVGEFMRIKVSLDVFQPLHKEMQVPSIPTRGLPLNENLSRRKGYRGSNKRSGVRR